MSGTIIGNIKLINSKIDFPENGKNNFVFCDNTDGDVVLEKSSIVFKGDNNVVFLVGGSKKSFKCQIFAFANSSVYIGKNALFHKSGNIHILASENTHVFIGADTMMGNGIYIRTGDAHPVYSAKTFTRINKAKNIIIGDHVWLAQDAMVLKGVFAGSGSIFGARSLLSNKRYFSNSSYAGIPAKMISEEGDVFFDKLDTHLATLEKIQEYDHFPSDKFIFEYDERVNLFDKLNNFLLNEKDPLNIIEFYKKLPKDKNRFALASKSDSLS